MNVSPRLSWNLAADVREILTFHFMQNAVLAGTIVAVLSAVIGWFMVLRRQSFAGHTLSVVGFPGAAGAIWLGLSAAAGYYAFCIGAALLVAALSRGAEARQQEAALIGVVQAFALACGLLFISLYKGFLGGINALLFGNFLGITDGQVVTLLVLTLISLTVLTVIGRPLLFSSVDPEVAAAQGVSTRLLSVVFLVLLAISAAAVSQITGALLVFALLVMPAAAAQRLTPHPGWSLALSVAIGLAVTWLGLGVAYFSVYPIGFFITSFGFAGYVLAIAWQAARQRLGRRARPVPALS